MLNNVVFSQLISGNPVYNEYSARWQYLYNSFIGGRSYSEAGYLTRYALETDKEYLARCAQTPLDNQCKAIISIYNSFLFRNCPTRDFGSCCDDLSLIDFLEDVDFDGRDIDDFMREASQWAMVFGHTWIMVSKPSVDANTLADQLALGVRPYLSILSPLVVLDWRWKREISGRYTLDYFKYIEDLNSDVATVKEWYTDRITTYEVDKNGKKIISLLEEVNELGYIPAICHYSDRGIIRGIGISAIDDVADQQRYLYNLYSEAEQSIRLDSHPSLVTTTGVNVGTGSGALIEVPENLDPGLVPYVLDFNGASADSITKIMDKVITAIDKITNVGSIRATETRTMSGIAMETEFQLLNARLASFADNLELTEEQIWNIFCDYQQLDYDIEVEYPGSFAIRDSSSEIKQLIDAKNAATDAQVLKAIDIRVLEWLGLSDEELVIVGTPQEQSMTDNALQGISELNLQSDPETESEDGIDLALPYTTGLVKQLVDADKLENTELMDLVVGIPNNTEIQTELAAEGMVDGCPSVMFDKKANIENHLSTVEEANLGPAWPSKPSNQFWDSKAALWGCSGSEARSRTCSNCAFYLNTTQIVDCFATAKAEGTIPLATEVNPTWENTNDAAAYCLKYDITCTASRTCDDWRTGGPLTDSNT